MPTNTQGVQTRQDPRQVTNTLKKIVNYNDPGLTTGIAFEEYLPQGAFITCVLVETVVAFNGTPVLVFGTNAASYNNIVASGDGVGTTIGVIAPTRGLGRSIANTAAVLPVALLASGTPTAGQVVIVIEYEGGYRT